MSCEFCAIQIAALDGAEQRQICRALLKARALCRPETIPLPAEGPAADVG